jgi:PTS system mannose-specific IIB component
MPVVLFRVDDRLVHGQVVEGWVPYLGAQVVLVANDGVCGDDPRCRLMKMMIPESLEFSVVPIRQLAETINGLAGTRVLVLFSDLADVAAASEAGVVMETVNLGNLHHLKGGTEVAPSVYLNRYDLRIAFGLMARGVHLEVQEVPGGRCCDLVDVISEEDRS